MTDIVPRRQWGARAPKSRIPSIRTPTPELWLHHTVGSSRGKEGMRNIQHSHQVTRRPRFTDIGYTTVVDPFSLVAFEGRGVGKRGAHTFGHNHVSHGIAVMGNFSIIRPSNELIVFLAELVAFGHQQGWWPRAFSGGHRDTKATECPGNHLYPMIGRINTEAARILDAPPPPKTPPAPRPAPPARSPGLLQAGDKGEAVRQAQVALSWWKPEALMATKNDGSFGPETTEWVKRFQVAYSLNPTGVIDGVTMAILFSPISNPDR